MIVSRKYSDIAMAKMPVLSGADDARQNQKDQE